MFLCGWIYLTKPYSVGNTVLHGSYQLDLNTRKKKRKTEFRMALLRDETTLSFKHQQDMERHFPFAIDPKSIK